MVVHHIVKSYVGENDGLIGVDSYLWGHKYVLLSENGTGRGVSHADMIDLYRNNVEGFDVREFHVQLVYNLKKKGF